MDIERWVVGAEYDEDAFARLGIALRSLGYCQQKQWQGVAGSQDVSHWELLGPLGVVIVESETYVGLTVEGSVSAIATLRGRYEAAPSNPSLQRTAFGDR